MPETTIGISRELKSRLDSTRDGLGFDSHEETVEWLLDEVRR